MILYKSEQKYLKPNTSTWFFQAATSEYCTDSVHKSVWPILVFLNKSIFLSAFSRRTLQYIYAKLNSISGSFGCAVYWIGTSIILANRCIPVQTYKFSCICLVCLEDTSILLRKLEFNFGEQIHEEDDVSEYIYYNSKLLAHLIYHTCQNQ